MKHVLILVFGRVQGVFFRACTKQQADNIGISGWVRNRIDGSVEIYANGSEQQLRSLIKWCHIGSAHSKVTNVETKWSEEIEVEHDDFTIRSTI